MLGAETNVTPAGSGSVTVTLVAVAGPLLVTVSVYEKAWPEVTEGLDAVLAMVRSAETLKFVTSDSSVAERHCVAVLGRVTSRADCVAAAAFDGIATPKFKIAFVSPGFNVIV